MKRRPRRLRTLPLPQQAGILSNDPAFQRFAAENSGLKGQQFSPEAAGEYIRQKCQITSRRQLARNDAAAARFRALQTDFDAACGRIAEPR